MRTNWKLAAGAGLVWAGSLALRAAAEGYMVDVRKSFDGILVELVGLKQEMEAASGVIVSVEQRVHDLERIVKPHEAQEAGAAGTSREDPEWRLTPPGPTNIVNRGEVPSYQERGGHAPPPEPAGAQVFPEGGTPAEEERASVMSAGQTRVAPPSSPETEPSVLDEMVQPPTVAPPTGPPQLRPAQPFPKPPRQRHGLERLFRRSTPRRPPPPPPDDTTQRSS